MLSCSVCYWYSSIIGFVMFYWCVRHFVSLRLYLITGIWSSREKTLTQNSYEPIAYGNNLCLSNRRAPSSHVPLALVISIIHLTHLAHVSKEGYDFCQTDIYRIWTKVVWFVAIWSTDFKPIWTKMAWYQSIISQSSCDWMRNDVIDT
jgi:hypothetical protein